MLLDTCVISQHLKGSAPGISARVLRLVRVNELRISEITMYELERGFIAAAARGQGQARRRHATALLFEATVLPVAGALAVAADLFARAANAKPARKIDELDLLILATAVVNREVLLTSDTALFEHAQLVAVGEFVEHVPVA